jgi:hypothetical protein
MQEFLKGLRLTGDVMGQRLRAGSVRVAQTFLETPGQLEEIVSYAMAKPAWTPFMEDKFYYQEGQPLEEIFSTALKTIGVPEYEEKAKQLPRLTGKGAYDYIAKLSPEVARELQRKHFMQIGGVGEDIRDIFEEGRDEALSTLYRLITDPVEITEMQL